MSYTTSTLLRYPLVFGTILAGFIYAFTNRDKFMTDLDAERDKLDRTDQESKKLLLDSMDAVNKSRAKQ